LFLNIDIWDEVCILVSLIRAGADVDAINFNGASVSDVAYSRKFTGTYHKDRWEAALLLCGYDLTKFREGRATGVQFTDFYTIKHYKRLRYKVTKHLGRCPLPNVELASDSPLDFVSDDESDTDSDFWEREDEVTSAPHIETSDIQRLPVDPSSTTTTYGEPIEGFGGNALETVECPPFQIIPSYVSQWPDFRELEVNHWV
jgi:hypothetical protein